MYSIRSSWISSFFRDEPMFGLMRTTSRSESENFFFGQFHRQGDTLCEFWLHFQSAMEQQRNETQWLDHESKTCIPETLSTWFIEDDATFFTRAIFYKVQEEIISSCLDMQIKRMSEEINGVTHLEIRDVKVKNKLFKVSVSKDHALNTNLDVQGGCDVFTKRDHIAAMVGEQPSEEIYVLVPNVCKNKGNYFKRLIGVREKALNKSKKRSRQCSLCKAYTHDARRCVKRNKVVAE
ncbi:uncharacterized protein LOC141688322 [Apium graveolens]|uniref:uncharacterized protein LOC141688322 n=1 Tax=Apium graveolens TaxID=4045 RepID=UPI003D7B201F